MFMGFDDGKSMYIVGGLLCFCFFVSVDGYTDANDFKILSEFRDNLENPELLKWPKIGHGDGDPCGPPSWPHVFCSNGRVTQIQVQGLGLKGPLPQNLNQLNMLENVGLQRNNFNGKLPTFNGLSNLKYAFLDFNEFDTIPDDFFVGLSSILVLALDGNPLNQTSGWSIPNDIAESSLLVNFSCSSCNIIGSVPDFFGKLPSLSTLALSYNRLSGSIPLSFHNAMLQVLWLNNQDGDGMTGSIDVISTMTELTQVWIHGNHLVGSIPENIDRLHYLQELNVNKNHLVGLVPQSLAAMNLQVLDLSNNMFMGEIPEFKATNVSFSSNSFCLSKPGEKCAPQVQALLGFLHALNYPERLAAQWTGNDPCGGHWVGITCNTRDEVSVVNLQRLELSGTLSASLVNLSSLIEVNLDGNNLSGRIPVEITEIQSLRVLKLSGNDFEPPVPRFRDSVLVSVDGNPRLEDEKSPSQAVSPSLPPQTNRASPAPNSHLINGSSSNHGHSAENSKPAKLRSEKPQQPSSHVLAIASCIAGLSVIVSLSVIYCIRKGRQKKIRAALVVHAKDDDSKTLKIAVSNISRAGSGTECVSSKSLEKTQKFDSGSPLISLQLLRSVTSNFAQENELGRGGFGVVYKGQLEDGTKIAVKRMVVGAISNKALDEFRSEITVLSRVRHRNLVSLLGYAAEGNERLLVYEYMSQGALSHHLFRWKSLGLSPLSWSKRLHIALDVARGVEYLHTLAHQSFIHRDLKSANILLDDDFRAKVSDFGLVKLAADSDRSFATRLAGTFGYLAPEYAVTGKITTKVDVFSFGVILIELVTGLVALDEQRSEEIRYLVEWFWQVKSNLSSFIASIDPALDTDEQKDETIFAVAELAGYCTARDPNHRPEMGHAVNILGSLVEKWKPVEETEDDSWFDMSLPLSQMLKGWQQEEKDTQDFSYSSEDTKGSIPSKPSGFADSFTSTDAR